MDDHLVVRSGLEALLGTQPDIQVVGEAASGEEALVQVERLSPAVVIMDLAMGYLLKDAAPEEIFAAVRGAVQGKSVTSAPVASRLFQQLRNPDEILTPREAELLSLLIEGLSNRELGQRLFISEATVKTHLAHIYAKLGVETRAAAIATAIRREGMR